jgi:hypothetical protein
VINRKFNTLDELEKIFHMLSNKIDCKIISQYKMRFEKKSYFIQMINNYSVENKHDLTKYAFDLKT